MRVLHRLLVTTEELLPQWFDNGAGYAVAVQVYAQTIQPMVRCRQARVQGRVACARVVKGKRGAGHSMSKASMLLVLYLRVGCW